MRISLKKFTRDPYKYAKKAPLIILLGDDPTYALIPYVTYKQMLEQPHNQPQAGIMHQEQTKKPHGWLYRLLFS